jgi:hypothetical protein
MFPFRFHIHEIISFNSAFLQQNSIHRSRDIRFQRITINNYVLPSVFIILRPCGAPV